MMKSINYNFKHLTESMLASVATMALSREPKIVYAGPHDEVFFCQL